ncbi:MAG: undecaprenyldiphospho-muramoylpentapeptide beta-N-acetylglucosaminyltransferase [Clostridia bacterium]|nr:undecaprenyldiphospho-muramoylpentapeptide beta-N-acetylglucosaminyltransferase [Clostridia bacterium]
MAISDLTSAQRLRFILAGGGTGGHIYPAISIGRELLSRHPGAEILFVGGDRGLERDLVPREGFPFRAIRVSGFRRKLSADTIATAFRAVQGVFQSVAIIRGFRPTAVIGTGGYASGPVGLAAVLLGCPLIIHEQNVVPGVTNRMLSRSAQTVAISWEESRRFLRRPERAVLTGNPIRADVMSASRDEGIRSLGLNPRRKVVLAFGGSQGSETINKAFIAAAAGRELRCDHGVQLVLACGKGKFDTAVRLAGAAELPVIVGPDGIGRSGSGDLILMPYIYNMPQALACADLVVSRSGAITLAELAARGVPAVLVPHPYVPDNVQEKNARAMAARGAARVILDRDLTPESLTAHVVSLISSPSALRQMGDSARAAGIPDATARVADCVERAVGWTCSRKGQKA